MAKFDVYYNLHKKLFSLKSRDTGRVVDHFKEVRMENVDFKVSQAGRERVLKEKRKNVHAFVRGEVVGVFPGSDNHNWTELTYNPYKYNSFVIKATEAPVFTAKKVVLKDKKIFAIL